MDADKKKARKRPVLPAVAFARVDALEKWCASQFEACQGFFHDDKLYMATDLLKCIFASIEHNRERLGPAVDRLKLQYEEDVRVQKLQAKERETETLLQFLESDEGWTEMRNSKGVKTFYRKEEGVGTHSFKVVGMIEAPLNNIVAVFYELDLYPQWFPLMKASRILERISRFRVLVHMVIKGIWPVEPRDIVVDGCGIDMLEENKVVIFIRSTDHCEDSDVPLPPVEKGVTRAEIRLGGFLIEPLSLDKAAVHFVVNVDPKMKVLPLWLLNVFVGRIMHVIFGRIAKQARKIEKEGEKSPYRPRILGNPAVYEYIHRLVEEHCRKLAEEEKKEE